MVYLVVGFFVGVIYENIVIKMGVETLELFFETNLSLYQQTKIVTNQYLVYVLRERIVLFLGIGLLGYFKWKKAIAILLVSAVGFLSGILVILAVLELGVGGVLICGVGVLPQGIFYGMAGYLLVLYWYGYPMQRWNRIKSIFIIVMLGIGILLEVYVNPIVVRWAIEVIH